MLHPIQQRVEQVRSLARSVVCWHAVGWFVFTIAAAFVSLTVLDYTFRPIDIGSRGLLGGLWCVAVAWASWHWLRAAWNFHPTLLETAAHIERRFHSLQGQLTGSLEFLTQSDDDPTAGSVALRRRVIASAAAAIEPLSFPEVIALKPRRRAWYCITGTLLFFLAWLLLDHTSLWIAAQRIAIPWSQVSWPRQHYLAYENPPVRVARGTTCEIIVTAAQGNMPNHVTLMVRRTGGNVERHEMKYLDGRMVARLDNMLDSLEYRAIGGDDHTLPWQRLEVVDPLVVSQLRVRVEPPRYAGAAWETDGTHLTLLAGSQLLVSGTFDQQVQDVTIRSQDDREVVHLVLDDDLKTFHSPSLDDGWRIQQSGVYQLCAKDREGLSYPPAARWELRVLPDLAPTVSVEEPAEDWLVTAQAMLPVSGNAKDDLALQTIQLRYQAGVEQAVKTLALWQADQNLSSESKGNRGTSSGDTRRFLGEWDLREIANLQPGHTITWQVEAIDFLPQTGRSSESKITIISPNELTERLSLRQRSALAQLAEAAKLQRDAQQEMAALHLQWSNHRQVRSKDRDQIASAELIQRQVRQLVGTSSQGAITLLEKVLRELEMNRLPLSELQSQAETLRRALREIESDDLASISQQLESLLLDVRDSTTINDLMLATSKTVETTQGEVVEKLELLLGDLNTWDHFQQLHKDLTALQKQQRQTQQKTAQLQQALLANSEPTEQQIIDLKQLAREQAELARQAEKWLARLTDFSNQAEASNDSRQVAQAAQLRAGEVALTTKIRDAVTSLERQKLGEGQEKQQQALAAMEAVLDALAGRTTTSAELQLQQLRDTARRLNEMLRQQQEITQQLGEQPTAPQLEKLADRQALLEQATREVTESLNKQEGTSTASEATKQAAESMKAASAAAKQKQTPAATEQARAAEKKLIEAQQAVRNNLQQQEADLLNEQLVRLEQILQGFLVRQAALHTETKRLEALSAASSAMLTAVQQGSCRELSREQRSLAEEVAELSRSPKLPGVLVWQLERIAQLMQQSENSLATYQVSPAVITQSDALARLQLLLTALEPNSPSPMQANEPPPDQPPPPSNENQPPPSIHDLAEVKLLRGLQAEINRRTVALAELRLPNGELPEQYVEQSQQLAQEQAQVVEMTLKLVQKLAKPNPGTPAVTPEKTEDDFLKRLDDALLPEGTQK